MMPSANIGLAMLCLHCSTQALAQAGCNFNYPKRHYLTLAMQLFSSNPATYFHQQVHFCSSRMLTEPLSVPSWTTARLILQLLALEGTVHSYLMSFRQWHHPFPSHQHWHGSCPAGQSSRKTCCIFCFPFASLGKAPEAQSQGKEKLDQSSCTFKTYPIVSGVEKSTPS